VIAVVAVEHGTVTINSNQSPWLLGIQEALESFLKYFVDHIFLLLIGVIDYVCLLLNNKTKILLMYFAYNRLSYWFIRGYIALLAISPLSHGNLGNELALTKASASR
jgi:hypothetical protein